MNAIWQGDASAMSLQSLSYASSPPLVLNITGPELLSVAVVARQFGKLLRKPAHFEGVESKDALLSNAGRAFTLFGRPQVSVDQLLPWIADWVEQGGESFDKPTHFENRSGNF